MEGSSGSGTTCGCRYGLLRHGEPTGKRLPRRGFSALGILSRLTPGTDQYVRRITFVQVALDG